MSELIDRYVNEHKDEWYAQGKEEGEADKANQIALALVQNGVPIEVIANSTGLPIENVKAMKESLRS